MPAKYTAEQREATFWAKVDKAGPIPESCPDLGPCYIWLGCTLQFGYGQMRIGNRNILTHRWAWEQAFGHVPGGLFVLHRCDTPPCVRASHLFLGTIADNSTDMAAKGRSTKGRPWSAERRAGDYMVRGEDHPAALLTIHDITAIRNRRAAGERLGTLAREFGVTETTICDIAHRKTWRHVD